MSLRIYRCNHVVPERFDKGPIFRTLISGVPSSAEGVYDGDLDGVNISEKNIHSEMRHQFYVWKNLLANNDYVGFEHYRRTFFLDPLPEHLVKEKFPRIYQLRKIFTSEPSKHNVLVKADLFSEYLDMRESLSDEIHAAVENWVRRHDVVVQRAHPEPLDVQWRSIFGMNKLWSYLLAAAKNTRFFASRGASIETRMQGSYCNMYIMRSELFDEYMEFWSEAMSYLEPKLEPLERLYGHFAERLFNMYLYQKQIETPLLADHRLPFLICDQQIA
jgi:hypothetical protein